MGLETIGKDPLSQQYGGSRTMTDPRPTWQLLLEVARHFNEISLSTFRMADLVAGVQRIDPGRGRGSIQPLVQGMTLNASGGPSSPCGKVFMRTDRGWYRLLTDGERTTIRPRDTNEIEHIRKQPSIPGQPSDLSVSGVAMYRERPWFWEGNVQAMLGQKLIADGWTVQGFANTDTKEQGIDLLVQKDDRWLAIEVKGFPNTVYDRGPNQGRPKPTQPANQARQWFSHALLSMMLLRHKLANAEIAICLPDFPTYRSLVHRTSDSFSALGFGVYLVKEDGEVQLELQHRSERLPQE